MWEILATDSELAMGDAAREYRNRFTLCACPALWIFYDGVHVLVMEGMY